MRQISSARKAFLGLVPVLLMSAFLVSSNVAAQSSQIESKPVGLQLIVEGLTSPLQLVPVPDESGRLFVVDQIGQVRIIAADGTLVQEPFLDVQDRMVELDPGYDERGLLGLAFHPAYARNGLFFVYYSAPLQESAPDNYNHTARISEFQVSESDPNRADADSERIILQVDKPQSNHNGGTLLFGPEDGYLYISIGDGGAANDVGLGHVEDWYDENAGGNGQDVTRNLLGNILRIDVDAGDPYAIPMDNPFVNREGLDEIYAYGFRNPYRMSFDQAGEYGLLSVDAGQELWEEVSMVENGGNYGWNVKEGTHCFDAENPTESPEQCPNTVGSGHPDEGAPLIDPVIEFANSFQEGGLGVTVAAGQMYRGTAIPDLEGRYVFATWSLSFDVPSGRLFYAVPSDSGLWAIGELTPSQPVDGTLGKFVLGMGQDHEGEVYVLTSEIGGPTGQTGKIYKLVPPQ